MWHLWIVTGAANANFYYAVTVVPSTGFDRWIGFHPLALPLYLSLWVYLSIPPWLLDDRRQLIAYGLATVGICGVGLAIFFFWPTVLPRPDIDWNRYPGFTFLKGIDRSGNACPSLHVAFAIFSALEIDRPLRRLGAGGGIRLLNAAWALGILYSTLAIKQHVAVDVLAGAALGAAGAALHGAYARRAFPA